MKGHICANIASTITSIRKLANLIDWRRSHSHRAMQRNHSIPSSRIWIWWSDDGIMAEQDYVPCWYRIVNQTIWLWKCHGLRTQSPCNIRRDRFLYESAITPNTRLLMLSHMVNITGHILPSIHQYGQLHSRSRCTGWSSLCSILNTKCQTWRRLIMAAA